MPRTQHYIVIYLKLELNTYL